MISYKVGQSVGTCRQVRIIARPIAIVGPLHEEDGVAGGGLSMDSKGTRIAHNLPAAACACVTCRSQCLSLHLHWIQEELLLPVRITHLLQHPQIEASLSVQLVSIKCYLLRQDCLCSLPGIYQSVQ